MGLVSLASFLVKIFASINGAWATFKVLKGELKLASLIWLVTPGSSAPQWLFDRLLHPAMAVAAFHLQRDIIPRIAAAALHTARKLQTKSLPRFANAVRRDELKMWDRSIRGQLACVQMELERRRVEGAPVAVARLPDPPAAALLRDAQVSRKQILQELLEPAATATANGGICGAYKRGESMLPSRVVSRLGRAAGLAGGGGLAERASSAGAVSDGEASEGEAAARAASRAVRFAAEDEDEKPEAAQVPAANPRTPPAQSKMRSPAGATAVGGGMAALPPSPATSMMSGRTGMLNTPAGRSVDTSVLTAATGEGGDLYDRDGDRDGRDAITASEIALLKTPAGAKDGSPDVSAEDRRVSHVNMRRRSAKKSTPADVSSDSPRGDMGAIASGDTSGEVAI